MRFLLYIFASAFMAVACLAPAAHAKNAERKIVVNPVPAIKPIKHVAAEKTHSGYPVPRYVSLKFGHVNGRQGPSLRQPMLWQYRRRGLPLIVVAEMDIWRKVRDMHGDESWVRTQALSGEKYVVTLNDIDLLAKPRPGTRVKATATENSLLQLGECNENNWCRVSSDAGHRGWVEKQYLWGTDPL